MQSSPAESKQEVTPRRVTYFSIINKCVNISFMWKCCSALAHGCIVISRSPWAALRFLVLVNVWWHINTGSVTHLSVCVMLKVKYQKQRTQAILNTAQQSVSGLAAQTDDVHLTQWDHRAFHCLTWEQVSIQLPLVARMIHVWKTSALYLVLVKFQTGEKKSVSFKENKLH